MTILNTKDAFRLYNLIGSFIPEETGEDVLDFIGKIVDNIVDAGHPEVYVKSIALVSGKNTDDIISAGVYKAMEWFIEGLAENEILSLKELVERL